jgi:hypothetical protein
MTEATQQEESTACSEQEPHGTAEAEGKRQEQ